MRQFDRWLPTTAIQTSRRGPIVQSDEYLRYFDDPVGFVLDILNAIPAPYQAHTLEKLVEERRVSVRGPHGLGKSADASWAVLWFACTRPEDTKIPTTASAWRQLEKFLWPEIRKWTHKANWSKWQEMGGIIPEVFMLKLMVGQSCEAFALASDRAELIEGAHGQNLLYVFDESKAIPDETWDAAEGAFASGDAYWLSYSTPGDRAGRFYDIQRRAPGYEDWYVQQVTLEEAIEAGRINPGWAEERKRQWGEDSPVYQARVLGEFPDMTEDTLIALSWLEAARDRNLEIKEKDKEIAGVDVARFGDDDSAMFVRQGPVVLSGEWWHGHDTMQTTGKVKASGYPANVDVIGMGSGVVDRLKEQKHKTYGINVGEGAKDNEHFVLLRDELHWALRDRFKNGDIDLSRLPQYIYDRLSGELTAIKFTYTSRGQIKIESKADVKKRLRRSPDLADALMIAFAPPMFAALPDQQPAQESKFLEEPMEGKSRWKRY